MPDVPGPDECDIRTHRFEHESVASRMEQRLAIGRPMDELDGTPSDGSCALWARMPEVLEMSAAALAVLGDFVPFGIGQALGLHGGRQQPGQHAPGRAPRADRLGPARHPHPRRPRRVRPRRRALWAETGELLAIASQSTIVRFWKDHGQMT